MSELVIKELFGFSGNKIFLIKENDRLFVRKIGSIKRNVERMQALSEKYPLPTIYKYSENELECEYIHSLDIKSYLLTHDINELVYFLITFFDSLSINTKLKDYTQIYIDKLSRINFCKEIVFTKDQLLEKLPKILPASEYFGDLTLENILYSESKGFVLIDCQTVEYDSYIFDIAKLRQDLESKWFLRNDNILLDVKLHTIQRILLEKYPEANNDYLLILMLLRAYNYSKIETYEHNFLVRCMNTLWQNSAHCPS